MAKAPLPTMLALVLALAAYADDSEPTLNQVVFRSNDFLTLVEEHWPQAMRGDATAMAIAYEALNNCSHFQDQIQSAETIDDFDAAMKDEHPSMQKYGHGIYFRCKQLVEHYDDYPGWRGLRLKAAVAGEPTSRLFMVSDFYRFRRERPREAFPFSPAVWVTEALEVRFRSVFSMIATGEAPWGLRRDSDPEVSIAWLLVGCHYGRDCEEASSVEPACWFMTDACGRFHNQFEVIRDKAGSDEAYQRAEAKAAGLIEKIDAGLYDELGLDLVW